MFCNDLHSSQSFLGNLWRLQSPREHLKVDYVLIRKLGKKCQCSVAAYEFFKINEY